MMMMIMMMVRRGNCVLVTDDNCLEVIAYIFYGRSSFTFH